MQLIYLYYNMDNTVYISVNEGDYIVFNQRVNETSQIYEDRILFLIKALHHGLDIKRAETLSFSFTNKNLFGVTYSTEIENLIKIISEY